MKSKTLDRFNGIVVLGLNGHKDNHDAVAVWELGAMLNEKNPTLHYWESWDKEHLDPLFFSTRVVRHYPIGKPKIMSKAVLKNKLGIKNLSSTQRGHKYFKNTLMGDVLYITYDTNSDAWAEAVNVGFIDKKCKIAI